MSRRLKVLISAYAVSPVRGSEPGMGWGWVLAAAREHDVWVITEADRFRDEVEAGLEAHPELREHLSFHYVPRARHDRLRRLWPPSYYWFYAAWQREAKALAQELHAAHGFDLVHQLNLVGYREPGYLYELGLPFVWGPVGGLVQAPWRFLPVMGVRGGGYHLGKNAWNELDLRLRARPRRAARAAAGHLIAATRGNAERIQRAWGVSAEVVCEVGPPDALDVTPERRSPGEPLRVVWSAGHVHGKALGLLLRALAQVPASVAMTAHILGDGPKTREWQRLAARLGVDARCQWHGRLPRSEAVAVMRRGHVMVITSLADLTSTVLLEALSSALPVVALDHCGFTDVVDDTCGLKLAVDTPGQVVADLAAALLRLERDETARLALAHGARARAKDFSWDRKAERLAEIYRSAVAAGPGPP